MQNNNSINPHKAQLNTPVAFIIFNRPEKTEITFNEIAKELRKEVERAITTGPMDQCLKRLDHVLAIFESQVASYADDEASRRTLVYYEGIDTLPDGDPIFKEHD